MFNQKGIQILKLLALFFNLESILIEGLGMDELSCFDVPVTDYRFEYTHYGRVIEERERLINEDGCVEIPYYRKRVLGAYTDGLEFSVSDTVFDYDYWFPE